jgi:hypothetical protein
MLPLVGRGYEGGLEGDLSVPKVRPGELPFPDLAYERPLSARSSSARSSCKALYLLTKLGWREGLVSAQAGQGRVRLVDPTDKAGNGPLREEYGMAGLTCYRPKLTSCWARPCADCRGRYQREWEDDLVS